MKSKKIWLVLAIILFGAILRLWQLGAIPVGFYSDEALYGYEAYSLMQTGKDQFGNSWPVSIAGFGDYRPALYIYTTIPFIKIFGLTEFATRLPSALFSIGTLIFTYLLINLVTKNFLAAIFGTFLMALSPWSIYFGRMAHETNLLTFLVTTGTYILFRFQGKAVGTIGKIVLFAAGLYTYHSARIFVPAFLLFVAFIYKSKVKKHILQVVIGVGLFLILLIPLVGEFRGEGAWARVQGVSLWTDPGFVLMINEQRGNLLHKGLPSSLSRLLINKVTAAPFVFTRNFLSHFTPEFLLTKGDPNGIYNTPNVGILLWIEVPLILFGIYALWKKDRRLLWVALGALFLSLVPDSLTRLSPSSARIHLALPFVALLTGSGCAFIWQKNKAQRLQFAFLFFIVLTLNSLWFWHQYLVVLPTQNARAWQIGVKEMIYKAQELAPQYKRVWISRNGWGWIHLVFHTKYDPSKLQKEIVASDRNDLGFWWVSDIGNYHLEWFPKPFVMAKDTLYVGIPEEFPKEVSIVDRVVVEGKDAYWLAVY